MFVFNLELLVYVFSSAQFVTCDPSPSRVTPGTFSRWTSSSTRSPDGSRSLLSLWLPPLLTTSVTLFLCCGSGIIKRVTFGGCLPTQQHPGEMPLQVVACMLVC